MSPSAHRCLEGLEAVAPAFPISTLRDLSLGDTTAGKSAVLQDGQTAGDTNIDNATRPCFHPLPITGSVRDLSWWTSPEVCVAFERPPAITESLWKCLRPGGVLAHIPCTTENGGISHKLLLGVSSGPCFREAGSRRE